MLELLSSRRRGISESTPQDVDPIDELIESLLPKYMAYYSPC